MATSMNVIVNKTATDNDYQTSPSNFVVMDLTNDYLIWTDGGTGVDDGDDEPTSTELNEASPIIDADNPVTVGECYVYDASEGVGTIRDIDNMGASDKRYVFGFSFDGDTASEPQLEAWDDDTHLTTDYHVLGNGTPANSMVKADCTTNGNPTAYTAIAGASNVLLLNDGAGALSALASGESSQELYANIKITIPAGYSTPAVESFILTCRYTWN